MHNPADRNPRAVLLVGHGAPPRDAPPSLVARLKALEGARRRSGAAPSDEERALDAQLRTWPRDASNDPYREGLLRLAAAMQARTERTVALAFNELCAPSIEEAIGALVAGGAREIVVVTTMVTPGGVHAEVEIPEAVELCKKTHSSVEITFAFPFDLGVVAEMLLRQAGAS